MIFMNILHKLWLLKIIKIIIDYQKIKNVKLYKNATENTYRKFSLFLYFVIIIIKKYHSILNYLLVVLYIILLLILI